MGIVLSGTSATEIAANSSFTITVTSKTVKTVSMITGTCQSRGPYSEISCSFLSQYVLKAFGTSKKRWYKCTLATSMNTVFRWLGRPRRSRICAISRLRRQGAALPPRSLRHAERRGAARGQGDDEVVLGRAGEVREGADRHLVACLRWTFLIVCNWFYF